MKKTFKEWDTKYINSLPDSSFAYISSGGKKDDEGKTKPRSLRHLPYKDKNGKIDLPHVRNALARLSQTDIPESVKPAIKKKLENILAKEKASEGFTTNIVQREDKSLKATLPFEFDDDVSEDSAVKIPSTIHLIPIGQWEHDLYGPIIINASDIEEYKKNFDNKIRKGVFITAGHEDYLELPAVGWVTTVEVRGNGLWGLIEWNELGKDSLSDKQFKFFSPEMYQTYEDPESHKLYKNVLTGGALTKSPYFKELKSVVFSEPKKNIKNNFNNNDNIMSKTLEEVLEIEVADLSDEDKVVLKENADKLSDEQKTKFAPALEVEKKEVKEEENSEEKKPVEKEVKKEEEEKEVKTEEEKKIEASESVMISATELNILRSKANDGAKAFKELVERKLNESVSALVFSESNKSGKFLPKSKVDLRAFMATLNDAQKAKFTSLLAELPKTQLFQEIGSSNKAGEGTAQAEVELKVNEKMKANDKVSYSDALKEVMSENTGLENRYSEELSSATKV